MSRDDQLMRVVTTVARMATHSPSAGSPPEDIVVGRNGARGNGAVRDAGGGAGAGRATATGQPRRCGMSAADPPDAAQGRVDRLAVLSTGELIPNPRHLDAALHRLRRLGRAVARKAGPDRRTGRRPSKRWERAHAALGRAHARVANLRRDGLHNLTTTLAREYGTVVLEDLNVAGMLRNRRLARHIADAGLAELRRELAYKTRWNGGRLVVADRWYPSSKTCSGCIAVKTKLALAEPTYTCTPCDLHLDRDLNAARNLAALVATIHDARSGRESLNGRGADRKTRSGGQVAVKRQPGTAPADKTGAAAPQGAASRRALTKAH